MAPKRVLKCLSIEDKFKLIKEIERGSKKKDVAVKYCIPASTISTILKNKDSIISSFESGTTTGGNKRMKKPMFENVDKAILDWFIAARNQNMPISSNILKEKALEFAKRFGSDNFKASTGWLDKWKQRHGVHRKKVCGENNPVRSEDCNKWTIGVLPHLLEKYNELDIFIADETGLFYQCLPDKTLTLKNVHGGKRAVESDNEDSVEECVQQPSKNDVVDSLRYLNLYLQSNDNTTDDHYEALNKLEALFTENIRKK